jgi:hypothetical protein
LTGKEDRSGKDTLQEFGDDALWRCHQGARRKGNDHQPYLVKPRHAFVLNDRPQSRHSRRVIGALRLQPILHNKKGVRDGSCDCGRDQSDVGCRTRPDVQLTEFGEGTEEEVVDVTQRGREGRAGRTQLGGPADNDQVPQLLKSGILGHDGVSLDNGLLWLAWYGVDAPEGQGWPPVSKPTLLPPRARRSPPFGQSGARPRVQAAFSALPAMSRVWERNCLGPSWLFDEFEQPTVDWRLLQ